MLDEWPNWDKVDELVRTGEYKAGNSEFTTFKKKVLKADVEEIACQAAHAAVMWDFLIGFAAVKKMYRSHILQVFHKLAQVPQWVAAWEAQPELHVKMQSLHEDLQAALGAQHDSLQNSISVKAAKSIVRVEDTPAEVSRAAERERIVDEIRESNSQAVSAGSRALGASQLDTASDAPFVVAVEVPTSSTDAEAAEAMEKASPELTALQEGIDASVGAGSAAGNSVDALNRLRIGCIQCAGREEFFQRESSQAHEVFSFLLGCAQERPAEVHHIAQVVNQLMASPSWSVVLEASPVLSEALQKLPLEAQAALGLQHEKVMALISAEGREKATRGDLPEVVKSVAPKMESIRSMRPVPVILDPTPPKPIEEWKEAKTPEGHSYYFNARTRESTWVRPAALGGPRIYKEGDAVEVWSNSQKSWLSGKVEKADGDTVTASFSMPGGGMAKKELPMSHKDLRPKSNAGFSEEEKAEYRRMFDSVAGPPEAKPGKAVAELLRHSGLSERQLAQVWAVANPMNRAELNFREFSLCCRLVAHCQALGDAPVALEAERELRVKLRCEYADARPTALPRFEHKAVVAG